MNQGLRQKDLVQPPPPGSAAPTGAAVNAGVILEPAERDPRQRRAAIAESPQGGPRAPERSPALPARSPAPRPAPGQGLRLLPLSGFFWGGPLRGRAGPGLTTPTPRVRGDHVILLVKEGSVAIELPRMQHLLGAGRIACIPLGTAFALKPPTSVSGWALLIPAGLAANLPLALPQEFRVGMPDAADLGLIEPTLCALGQGHPRGQIEERATACHLGLLAVALSRLHDHSELPGHLDRAVVEARPLTERFLALAAGQLARNRTVAEIAGDLGCSLADLDHACRQSRGRSALDLVYALRLERAVELLRNDTMPVAQIADELGYTGLAHFIRAFSAATGRSPQAFRDGTLNGEDVE